PAWNRRQHGPRAKAHSRSAPVECSGASSERHHSLLSRNQFFPERVIEQHFLHEIMLLLRDWRLSRVHRQPNREGRPLVGFTAGVYSSPMMMDYKITSHQMNPVLNWAVASHHEWIKDQPERFFRQAWS